MNVIEEMHMKIVARFTFYLGLLIIIVALLSACDNSADETIFYPCYTPRRVCPPDSVHPREDLNPAFPDEIIISTEFESYTTDVEYILVTLTNSATTPEYILFLPRQISLEKKTEDGWTNTRLHGMQDLFFNVGMLYYGESQTFRLVNGCFNWDYLGWDNLDCDYPDWDCFHYERIADNINIVHTHEYVLTPGIYRIVFSGIDFIGPRSRHFHGSSTVWTEFVIKCDGIDRSPDYTMRRMCPPPPSLLYELTYDAFPDEITFSTEFERYAVGTESVLITLTNSATDPRYKLHINSVGLPIARLYRKLENGWLRIWSVEMYHEMFRNLDILLSYGESYTFRLVNSCADWYNLDEYGHADYFFFTHDYVLTAGTYRIVIPRVGLEQWEEGELGEMRRVSRSFWNTVRTEFTVHG